MSGGPSSRMPCKASVRASIAEKRSSSSMILDRKTYQQLFREASFRHTIRYVMQGPRSPTLGQRASPSLAKPAAAG